MSPLTPTQRDIVADLEANLIVTSGAGCGKTLVLVERYIRFLEQDLDLPLQHLAAITFTENAAAEMRQRIREACRQEVAKARRQGDAHRASRWRTRYWDVDVAPIDTIHGFCAGLLRRYPIEAGVDPNFALLDEAESALLQEDVVAATVETLLEAEEADLLAVLEHHDLLQTREMLATVLAEKREVLHRVAAPVMDESDEAILRRLRKMMDETALEEFRGWLEDPIIRDSLATLKSLAGAAEDKREQCRAEAVDQSARLAAARTAATARAAAEWLAEHIDLRPGSAARWPSEEAFKAAKAALATVRDAIRKVLKTLPAYDEDAERKHLVAARAFYRTARRVMEAYEAAKRDRSALDFEDLQILARDLLRNPHHPQVLKDCRRRFRAILVDELQDTNFLQFEIVDLLVSSEARRGRAPLRRGALFGVGDPKQSIYRFRGAEFEVFRAALDRIEPRGRKHLRESWRLHDGTAALANHLFPPLMGDLYEPIEGRQKILNEAVGEWRIVRSPDAEPLDAETGQMQEAMGLAARLQEIVKKKAVTVRGDGGKARPARYGDVAILLRRMSRLHLYEEALERQGIPYYVVAGHGFYRQQEVIDVVNLLRVLDDPADELHLAGVLRSPFFSASDEALYHLKATGRPLFEALGAATEAEHLDPEDRRALARAARRLSEWAAAKDRTGLGALVDLIVFESGYAASAVGRFGGVRAYANLRQMVELARRFERNGLYALGDYIDYVTDFLRSEMRAEQAPIEAPDSDAVRLMTIHKAKGLEFPIVAIPDLGHTHRAPPAPFLVHPATGVAVGLRGEEGERCVSGAMLLARRDAAEADRAESHRLFYVAMTRAKDYLVFTSHVGHKTSDEASWHDRMLAGLGATLEPGERTATLPTGHRLRLSVQPPQAEMPRGGPRRGGPRDLLVGGRVAWDRLRDRAESAPKRRVAEALAAASPPAAPAHPPRRITATAMESYRRCPALYRWSEVFGLSEPEPPEPRAGLSPRDYGVLSHRAMELAGSPDAETVRRAVEGALREVAAAGPAPDDLRRRLTDSVRAFWASPLGRRVAASRRPTREMPMLLRLDETEIRGTIDLVFEGTDGRWELVDYKTSGPSEKEAETDAARYELQLGLYALAAGRWLGRPIGQWSIHFLGSAVTVEREVAPADLRRIEEMARQVLAGITAGRFECADPKRCASCRYTRLCREDVPNKPVRRETP
jgi:ATP-dependent helicase/nuclease subunit A